MPDTFTPNYNLTKPAIGGDSGTWGTLLNGDMDLIDAGMAANLDLAGSRTMTGPLKLAYAVPIIQMKDTSEVLPAGMFRMVIVAGNWEIQRNTAAAGDFSTNTAPLYLDAADGAHFAQSVVSGTSITAGTTLSSGTGIVAGTSVTANGTVVSIGTGQAAEMDLIMHNANTNGQFFLSAAGLVGFYDNTRALSRFSSDTSGNFTAAGDLTAFSDERFKSEWEDLPDDFVEQLAGVLSGTYSRQGMNRRQVGVGAQSLQKVMREAVLDNGTGVLSVAYGNAALAAVIKLSRRVLALEAEINSMRGDAK